MHRTGALRLTALAGLATAAATVAHGGFEGRVAWLAAALAAALLALAGGALAWRAVTRGEGELHTLPLPALAAALLAAQLAAHVGFGLAGAPAHAATGSLALHLLLALAVAVLVRQIESAALARREAGREPLQKPARPRPAPGGRLPGRRTASVAAPRAPPQPA